MNLKVIYIVVLAWISSSAALAQDVDHRTQVQANNPLSDTRTLSYQNDYIGRLSGTDRTANQIWRSYAQPVKLGDSRWRLAVSRPLSRLPVGPDESSRTGVGDTTLLLAYAVDTGMPDVSFSVGPLLTLPTAHPTVLGSNKWSTGLLAAYFNASSPTLQYGYLATWRYSLAGGDGHPTVNQASLRPMVFYQLGDGSYLRSSPQIGLDLRSKAYVVPLGLGVGHVFGWKKMVFNIFVEPQAALAHRGRGQPEWQVVVGVSLQFPL